MIAQRELWVDVVGYEGLYQVSNFGNVRSVTILRSHGGYRPRIIEGKILAKKSPEGKYERVSLWNQQGTSKKIGVHRLVVEALIPNPENFPVVRHLDDNKKNNNVKNLAWGTHKHNAEDKVRHNNQVKHKLTPQQAAEIKQRVSDYKIKNPGLKRDKFYQSIAAEFNVTPMTIYCIRDGRTWTHV